MRVTVGPSSVSARAKYSLFQSMKAKKWVENISCGSTTSAPSAAAARTMPAAFSRFSSRSQLQLIWVAATVTVVMGR